MRRVAPTYKVTWVAWVLVIDVPKSGFSFFLIEMTVDVVSLLLGGRSTTSPPPPSPLEERDCRDGFVSYSMSSLCQRCLDDFFSFDSIISVGRCKPGEGGVFPGETHARFFRHSFVDGLFCWYHTTVFLCLFCSTTSMFETRDSSFCFWVITSKL